MSDGSTPHDRPLTDLSHVLTYLTSIEEGPYARTQSATTTLSTPLQPRHLLQPHAVLPDPLEDTQPTPIPARNSHEPSTIILRHRPQVRSAPSHPSLLGALYFRAVRWIDRESGDRIALWTWGIAV